jgi:hypothetical protein
VLVPRSLSPEDDRCRPAVLHVGSVARQSRLDLLVGSLRLTYQFSPATPGLGVGFGAIRTEQQPAGVARLARLLR